MAICNNFRKPKRKQKKKKKREVHNIVCSQCRKCSSTLVNYVLKCVYKRFYPRGFCFTSILSTSCGYSFCFSKKEEKTKNEKNISTAYVGCMVI